MKKLLLFAALLLAAMPMSSANVDLSTAQATATRYLMAKAKTPRLAGTQANNLTLLHAEMNSSMVNQAVYYIFNSNQGFIIVSGDDRAQEILAHGDKPLDMKRMPENMKFWLSTYKRQLEYLQAHPGLEVKRFEPSSQKSLRTPNVAPMLTAEWDQSSPYYKYCKFGNYQCVTGCPATSLSMVFYYWKYPTDPTPEVEGYTNEASGYTFDIPALPSITFDWENMLDTYTYGNYSTEQADAVAWLMRYIGQEEHMEYSPSGSGAMGDDILRAVKFFGYDEDAQLIFKSVADNSGNETEYINDEDWAALLQNELVEGRPVVYCAYDYSLWYGWSGHAFNVDGYTAADNTYHVNWGWSGDGNGDFALNAFSDGGYTFNIEQQMIMGIQPPAKGPTIKATPSKLTMESYVSKTSTATFTVRGKELTSNVTLTLNDPNGVFSLDANSVALADLEAGKTITVTYAPQASGTHSATITLSNPDAEDVVVTIEGVATLETYVPVMLDANEQYINLTRFRAEWTDETNPEYISSYTLEVNTKPITTLLTEQDFSDYPELSGNQASNAQQYMPEGWVFNGSGLWLDGGCVEPSSGGTITTNEFDVSGYEKMTVIVKFKSWSSWTDADLTVATSKASQTFTGTNTYKDYVAVLDCDDTERIVFTAGYYPMIQRVLIYAGELEDAKLRAIVDEGDESSRLITGITNNYYDVKDLLAGGTFRYRVKALYTDGTESAWSKAKVVTLFENGPAYQLGDVNHDGEVDVNDVTALIDYLLGENVEIYLEEANMDGNTDIDINDVTMLIDFLLQ